MPINISKERQQKGSNQERAFGRPAGDEQPTRERVAQLAYGLYQHRGGEHGRDWEDWFRAEEMLKSGERPAWEPAED